jgi:hypothetical protein
VGMCWLTRATLCPALCCLPSSAQFCGDQCGLLSGPSDRVGWLHFNGALRLRTHAGLWLRVCQRLAPTLRHLRISGLQPHEHDETELTAALASLKEIRVLVLSRFYSLSSLERVSAGVRSLPHLRFLSLGESPDDRPLPLTNAFISALLTCPALRRVRVQQEVVVPSADVCAQSGVPQLIFDGRDQPATDRDANAMRQLKWLFERQHTGSVMHVRFSKLVHVRTLRRSRSFRVAMEE